jgi:hypothetical protein
MAKSDSPTSRPAFAIVLLGADRAGAIPGSLPLREILKRVTAFVREQRQRTGQRLRRGRKSGTIGVGINRQIAYHVALLHANGVRKHELLRLAGRDTDGASYRWLDARVRFGERLSENMSLHIREPQRVTTANGHVLGYRFKGDALERLKDNFRLLCKRGPASD